MIGTNFREDRPQWQNIITLAQSNSIINNNNNNFVLINMINLIFSLETNNTSEHLTNLHIIFHVHSNVGNFFFGFPTFRSRFFFSYFVCFNTMHEHWTRYEQLWAVFVCIIHFFSFKLIRKKIVFEYLFFFVIECHFINTYFISIARNIYTTIRCMKTGIFCSFSFWTLLYYFDCCCFIIRTTFGRN